MEKKELYEVIGRLYAQNYELYQSEEEWRQEAEKAKISNIDFQSEIDDLKQSITKKEDYIGSLETDLRNRDALIAGYEAAHSCKEQVTERNDW